MLHVLVGPVEHFGQDVENRLAGAVAVALVREHHQPRGTAVTLDRLEETLGLDREVAHDRHRRVVEHRVALTDEEERRRPHQPREGFSQHRDRWIGRIRDEEDRVARRAEVGQRWRRGVEDGHRLGRRLTVGRLAEGGQAREHHQDGKYANATAVHGSAL